MKRWNPLFDGALATITTLLLAILYAPLLSVGFLSVVTLLRKRGHLAIDGIDASSYASLFANEDILSAAGKTLMVGAMATLASLFFGLIFSFYYVRSRGLSRHVMQFLIYLPFLLPPVITGLSLLIYFRELNLARGLLTIVIGHTVIIVPIVYRTLLVRLQSIGRSTTEASYDLGASGLQTLWFVLLPQLGTALISSGLIAFALSFDETFVTLFLSGSDTTLPLRLWGMMRVGFVPEINALAVMILLLAACFTVAIVLLQRRASSLR